MRIEMDRWLVIPCANRVSAAATQTQYAGEGLMVGEMPVDIGNGG